MTVADFRQAAGDARKLPCSLEAEQALLGSLMFDNGAAERLPDSFRASHFFEPFHQRLFAAMEAAISRGKLAEPILLMTQFEEDSAFHELGGLRYLADMVDRAPPAANAPDYAEMIEDLALRREMQRLGGEMIQSADDRSATARERLEEVEGALFSLAETGERSAGLISFSDVIAGAVELAAGAYQRDGSLAGVSTGLIDLDRMLGGLHPSDLVILAARPSMGKTALATNIAYHIARSFLAAPAADGRQKAVGGGVVAFFSLEMSGEQLGLRILAEAAGVSSDKLRRGQIDMNEFARVRDAASEIAGAPLFVDATGGLAVGKLAARARRLKRKHGLDLIVVDYLQLCTAPDQKGQGRVQEVSAITQALKALAKELNVPVLALAQLSRQVETREDKRPQLADLRESGSIEQDADAVLFIYREAYYLGRAEPKEGTQEHIGWEDAMAECAHLAEVIIGKQRHGPIGTVKLHFNPDLTKFGNLARDDHYRDPSGQRGA